VTFPTVLDLEDAISPPHLHLLASLALAYFVLCLIQFASFKCNWTSSLISSVLCCVPFLIIGLLFVGALVNGATQVFPEWRIRSLWVLFDFEVSEKILICKS